MEIKIIKKAEAIIVSYGKSTLEISETSNQWNNDGINKFLVSIVSKVPNQEKLTIFYEEEQENKEYQLIVELFKSFIVEYNKN